MAKLTKVTQDDVDAAETALQVGRARLAELHEAFLDGRGEWQPVVDQKAVIEYAEAALLKTARDKSKYDEQVRQNELAALRKEIDSYSLASGDEFSTLLDAFESAAVAVAAAFQTRNEKVTGWQERMKALGVPALDASRLVPAPSEAGLGWREAYGEVDLQAGERKFRLLYSGRYLTGLLRGLGVERSASQYYYDENVAGLTIEGVRAEVARIDHELPPIPEDALFFRTSDGALIQTSPDHGFTPEQMKRDRLVQITRGEALGA